ncbi:MAG: stealth family protein [Clostridium sp.]|nr:stealth family protein [Clostridium sp.]
MNNEIDFTITWVDGNDEKWKNERNKYKSEKQKNKTDDNESRFRDWNLLKYWFRSVELYAPWVRKIHFITCGHLPEFLNVNAPKLNIVKHSDYMPEEYLPTFSSNPIELCMNQINGLSEQFVYFNDDTFLNNKVEPEDFFKNGKPCYEAVEACIVAHDIDEIYSHIMLNNISVINHRFNKRSVIKKNFFKWYNLKYGTDVIRNICFAPWAYFQNIANKHLPVPILKSTIDKVWKDEYEILHKTSMNRFRSITDVNQYLFRYWDIMSGNFVPKKQNGMAYHISDNDISNVKTDILKGTHKMICINDTKYLDDFENVRTQIDNTFLQRYPNKSSFEI